VDETADADVVPAMTDCNHSEHVISVSANDDKLIGLKTCKHCSEVIEQVEVERNINDLLDLEAAKEVLDLLRD
jgi:hypothetical protein